MRLGTDKASGSRRLARRDTATNVQRIVLTATRTRMIGQARAMWVNERRMTDRSGLSKYPFADPSPISPNTERDRVWTLVTPRALFKARTSLPACDFLSDNPKEIMIRAGLWLVPEPWAWYDAALS
jgi:hypothetical protein